MTPSPLKVGLLYARHWRSLKCKPFGFQVGVRASREKTSHDGYMQQVLLESGLMSESGSRSLHCTSPVPTHVALRGLGSGGLWLVWNPECTNLFPALVLLSPLRPGSVLELSTISACTKPAVSAQTRLGSVQWHSDRGFPSSNHTDTSGSSSSILINLELLC